MSKLNLNPMADWGYVNNSRFRFLSIRNQGGGVEPVPPIPPEPINYIVHYKATSAIENPEDEYSWLYQNIDWDSDETFYNESTGEGQLKFVEGTRTLGENAFSDLEQLVSIEIPNSIVEIMYEIFSGCTNLTSVKIPNSVVHLQPDIMLNTAWYEQQEEGILYLDNWIVGFKGEGETTGELIIPNGTRGVCDYVFGGCELITVVMPQSLYSIGDGAFNSCENLSDITFPDMVRYFGKDAISDTAYYDNLPDGIVYISGWYLVWKGEEPPTGVLILDSNTIGIQNYAFHDCTGLTGDLVIPSSVTYIGNNAFEGCTGLTGDLVIPSSVTYIGESAFQGCSGLSSVDFLAQLTSIPRRLFKNCSNIKIISLSNTIKTIHASAFAYCDIYELTIPENISLIQMDAFLENTNLCIINFNAVDCIASYNVHGDEILLGCNNITKVNIGNKVTSIPSGLCFGSHITEITIPKSVTKISYAGIRGSNLTNVTCLATNPPDLEENNFNTTANDILYVPTESVQAYLNNTNWNAAFGGNIQAIQE